MTWHVIGNYSVKRNKLLIKLIIMKRIAIIMTVFTIAFGGLYSCKKDDPMADDQKGKMEVRMTDAPADYEALNVEIAKVEAYHENSGWILLNSEAQSFNVLSLTNGQEISLTNNAEVEAGQYTMLRLTFGSDNTLTHSQETTIGGTTAYISVTSDLSWSGSKEVLIEIDHQVSASGSSSILLDFDAANSIIESGQQYVIEPTITAMKNTTTGIEGRVEGSANALVEISNGSAEYSTYISAEGEFLIRGIEEGTYDLIVYPCTEEVQQGAQAITIENITVVEGEFTNAGSINIE